MFEMKDILKTEQQAHEILWNQNPNVIKVDLS